MELEGGTRSSREGLARALQQQAPAPGTRLENACGAASHEPHAAGEEGRLTEGVFNASACLDKPGTGHRLDFLDRAENVILVGAQGLGKTTLAKNIAHQAILVGRSALFTTASDLILDLNGQETARGLERRIRHYVRPHLLVIDEIGYLSFDAHAADLLFQIVTRRHEERSIVLTTNLAFRDWATVFPNATCAVALVDRLTHHSTIVAVQGDSYRRRNAE
ncbi:MAG: ATP-binding protein [Vicinamibacteria bacterium]|nr:ATP-binding protein [Vicinamibacteria bacterium]